MTKHRVSSGSPHVSSCKAYIAFASTLRHTHKSCATWQCWDGAGALGSPGFISPEIITGEPHTYAMDVFAVGVILFVLLVGRKPFNIADSESLNYCAMKLADCPGIKDPRSHSTLLVGRKPFNMHGYTNWLACTVCTKRLLFTTVL